MCQSTHPYQIDEDTFSDGQHTFSERNLCQHCREEHEANKTPFKWADEQYSFGHYAGRYCEDCWKNSGFRDANDDEAVFDESFAGERLEDDY